MYLLEDILEVNFFPLAPKMDHCNPFLTDILHSGDDLKDLRKCEQIFAKDSNEHIVYII